MIMKPSVIKRTIIVISFFLLVIVFASNGLSFTHVLKMHSTITTINAFGSIPSGAVHLPVSSSIHMGIEVYNYTEAVEESINPITYYIVIPQHWATEYTTESAYSSVGSGDNPYFMYYSDTGTLIDASIFADNAVVGGTLNQGRYVAVSNYSAYPLPNAYENLTTIFGTPFPSGGSNYYTDVNIFASNLTFQNYSVSPQFQYKNGYLTGTIVKGQHFLFTGLAGITLPSSLTAVSFADQYGVNQIWYANITAQVNISIGATNTFRLFVQVASSLTFKSTFSYISNSCLYLYGYKPVVNIKGIGNNLSVSTIIPTKTSIVRHTTSLFLDGGIANNEGAYNNNYSLGQLGFSNSSYIFGFNGTTNTLSNHLSFYIPQMLIPYPPVINTSINLNTNTLTFYDTHTANKLLIPYENFSFPYFYLNDSSSTIFQNESLVWVDGANINPYVQSLVSNIATDTFLSYSNSSDTLEFYPSIIKSNINNTFNLSTKPLIMSFEIPITAFASTSTITNLSLSKMLFYVFENSTNNTIKTIYFGNKSMTATNQTSATFTNIPIKNFYVSTIFTPTSTFDVIHFYLPYNALYNFTQVNTNTMVSIVPFFAQLNYTLQGSSFSVELPYNTTGNSLNVNFLSGTSSIIPAEINQSVNKSGNSFIDNNPLSWTFNPTALFNQSFIIKLNNAIWTSNSKISFNGKNYTGTNQISIELNSSSTYNLNVYVLYNAGYKEIPITLTTNSFNACNSIYDYSTIISTTINTTTNIANATLTGGVSSGHSGTSTSTSTSTSTPTSTSTISLASTNTFFGKSYLTFGAFTFVFTFGFDYLIAILIIVLIMAKYLRQEQFAISSVIVSGVLFAVGFFVGFIPIVLFIIFALVLIFSAGKIISEFITGRGTA